MKTHKKMVQSSFALKNNFFVLTNIFFVRHNPRPPLQHDSEYIYLTIVPSFGAREYLALILESIKK